VKVTKFIEVYIRSFRAIFNERDFRDCRVREPQLHNGFRVPGEAPGLVSTKFFLAETWRFSRALVREPCWGDFN